MSNVVERDITHITSLHGADLGSQCRVTSKYVEYLIEKLIPRSEDRISTMNCATSMVKDEMTK